MNSIASSGASGGNERTPAGKHTTVRGLRRTMKQPDEGSGKKSRNKKRWICPRVCLTSRLHRSQALASACGDVSCLWHARLIAVKATTLGDGDACQSVNTAGLKTKTTTTAPTETTTTMARTATGKNSIFASRKNKAFGLLFIHLKTTEKLFRLTIKTSPTMNKRANEGANERTHKRSRSTTTTTPIPIPTPTDCHFPFTEHRIRSWRFLASLNIDSFFLPVHCWLSSRFFY